MKKFLLATSMLIATAFGADAKTINILMEGVPDTRYVQEMLPEFKEKTGIDVQLEVVNYAEMHTKLVPQLVSPEGSYDVLIVDFYWVGEFIKAGWLQPLDERIAADGIDTNRYIPSIMNLTGKVDGVTYMLPFYNYAMGLTYRTDLLADPKHQEAFKAKYGRDLKVPTEWQEYLDQVKYFTEDAGIEGFKGVVNQGLRPDPIAMEWSNYLFARGGRYYDPETWQPTLATPEGIQALVDYRDNIQKYGPIGAANFSFDDAFNVAAQGKAYSYLTFNMFRPVYDDPASSQVVGKMEITPVPGGSLNGSWGWAIPTSSPDADAAWEFIKFIESPEIAKKRAALGGAATQAAIFDDPDLIAKYSYYPQLKQLLQTSHNFPVFTYTPQFVEVLGRELSLAVTDGKDPKEALETVDREFAEMLRKDGKLQ
ncbi:MAG TPA: sugar ABC transporter substrate-binding protein [Geminicoccus sp.]|jgi:ABC-type glycerol-3-phosphate transport system substrate-binding protein|uniref:ABC transporter substrate-binding protein n=1 Tax=Geminicoccus sp. TaxID=2024832 RepID=UPI002E2F27AF|nr:sugar ABC transporter substrate-binding protein [Geminicoccus sp.]HEX2527157.1 sugar ABC transporter substrate-binding protein [Geminicoccus sp.]